MTMPAQREEVDGAVRADDESSAHQSISFAGAPADRAQGRLRHWSRQVRSSTAHAPTSLITRSLPRVAQSTAARRSWRLP